MKKVYLILALLLPVLAQAQRKFTASTAIWPELQFTYGVNEQGLLFLQNQYRVNTDSRYNDLLGNGAFHSVERVELTVGYEQTFTDHWRGGAMLRYAAEDFPKILFPTLFLRHNGRIGGLYFNKQALFEYVMQEESDRYGRVRLQAELGKRLPLGSKFLTPALRYEAMLLTDLAGDKDIVEEERIIDRTRLRLSLNYELTETLRIAPYFMRQTDYYYVQVPPTYSEDGLLLEEGYATKRNRISPVVGLELKYNLHAPSNSASITY
ncbi:DUF2490 domain-containing protein [Pontibacter chitinilyticus]|uniref:DUF2490 domain-containing protein n=1 Tax=Pontibacter chitinilyticus TaxID=2674989 RepID=UPI00321BD80A